MINSFALDFDCSPYYFLTWSYTYAKNSLSAWKILLEKACASSSRVHSIALRLACIQLMKTLSWAEGRRRVETVGL